MFKEVNELTREYRAQEGIVTWFSNLVKSKEVIRVKSPEQCLIHNRISLNGNFCDFSTTLVCVCRFR